MEAVWHQLTFKAERLFQQGHPGKAAKVSESALRLAEKLFRPNHPRVTASLENLARIYITRGKHAEALSLLERSLAKTGIKAGSVVGNKRVIVVMIALGVSDEFLSKKDLSYWQSGVYVEVFCQSVDGERIGFPERVCVAPVIRGPFEWIGFPLNYVRGLGLTPRDIIRFHPLAVVRIVPRRTESVTEQTTIDSGPF